MSNLIQYRFTPTERADVISRISQFAGKMDEQIKFLIEQNDRFAKSENPSFARMSENCLSIASHQEARTGIYLSGTSAEELSEMSDTALLLSLRSNLRDLSSYIIRSSDPLSVNTRGNKLAYLEIISIFGDELDYAISPDLENYEHENKTNIERLCSSSHQEIKDEIERVDQYKALLESALKKVI